MTLTSIASDWDKYIWYKAQVEKGGPWDLKQFTKWNRSNMYYGNIYVEGQDIGNIHYGYTVMGLKETVVKAKPS